MDKQLVTLSYPPVGVDTVSDKKINDVIETAQMALRQVNVSVEQLADVAQVSEWTVKDVQSAHDRIEKRKLEIAKISPKLEALEIAVSSIPAFDISVVDEKLSEIQNKIEAHLTDTKQEHVFLHAKIAELQQTTDAKFVNFINQQNQQIEQLRQKIDTPPATVTNLTPVLPQLSFKNRIKWLFTGKVD